MIKKLKISNFLVPSFNPILSQANESPIRSFANTTPTMSTATLDNSNDYPELVRI